MKTKLVLTLEDCRKIGAAAMEEARRNNWNVVIAVLDDGGHLRWLEAMDGTTPMNSPVAIDKGRSAAVTRRPTKAWQDRVAANVATLSFPLMTIQGGVPIMTEGQCLGGVGVSGVASHEDEQIAMAGIAALGLKA
jgi:uncharacterized protein GlcG (DUF336 family)